MAANVDDKNNEKLNNAMKIQQPDEPNNTEKNTVSVSTRGRFVAAGVYFPGFSFRWQKSLSRLPKSSAG